MNTIMIVDLSNILYSTYFNAYKDNQLQYINDKKAFWRYLILSELLFLKKKFNPKEIVLAIDSKNVWRKDYFKYYKARRIFKKQKSPIDWEDFYVTSDLIIDELINNFPCKYVKVDKAEADDIVATLAITFKDEYKILIVTKDKDMKQLLIYDNIQMYDLNKKELVDCDDPIIFRLMHILKGDDGDDIPNLLSDDNVFVCDDKRQKRITQKVINEALELGIKEYANKYNVVDNFNRNYNLVVLDVDTIPQEIQNDIIYKYNTVKIEGNFESLMKYINDFKMYSLLEEI